MCVGVFYNFNEALVPLVFKVSYANAIHNKQSLKLV